MITKFLLLLAVIAVFNNGDAAPVEESTERTLVVAPKDIEFVIIRKPVQVANSIKENEEDSGYVISSVLT
jgi:hypothetical protein